MLCGFGRTGWGGGFGGVGGVVNNRQIQLTCMYDSRPPTPAVYTQHSNVYQDGHTGGLSVLLLLLLPLLVCRCCWVRLLMLVCQHP